MRGDNVIEGQRPKTREVRIDDCSSVKVFDNPAPRCPHGKNWQESDYEIVAPAVRQLMCPRHECRAVEYHPHAGKFISLAIPRSFRDRQPVSELFAASVTSAVAGTLVDEIGRKQSVNDRLRDMLEKYVLSWDWEDSEDQVLPLPNVNWDAVIGTLEQSELWWIVRAVVVGGDPENIGVASGNSTGS